MIYDQDPGAEAVGTYEQWKSDKISRGVRRGAFPIKIFQDGKLEAAFDIVDTYGKAFQYKNSYEFTHEEKERLVSALNITETKGSADDRLYSFAFQHIMDKLNELGAENENFKKTFSENSVMMLNSATDLLKERYNLNIKTGNREDDLKEFQNFSAKEKLNNLQYIQPIVKTAILEIEKGIAKTQEKERTDKHGITDGIYAGRRTENERDVQVGQTESGRSNDSGGGNAHSGIVRGLGYRPGQMGLEVGGMDDGVPFGESGGVNAGAEIRRGGNTGEQGNRGVFGDTGEELEREEPTPHKRELHGIGAVRTGSEDVSGELPYERGEQQTLQREINERKEEREESSHAEDYALLSRLQSDCEYYLNSGRADKYLWAGNAQEQIKKMRELYERLPQKPQWLTKNQIDKYEREMLPKAVSTKKLTASVKWEENYAAISTLKELESTDRAANDEDIETLKKFSGFGSLPQVFDENNSQWEEQRNALKELLTKEEYNSLEESTLSAHYTDGEIIKAMYEGLESFGVKGGNILEPSMGNGAFFANMPQELKENSKLYGVELNSITGRMAQRIYPDAEIEVKGFEETDFKDGFFDAAAGNIPFGNFKLYDPKYNKMNLLVHDYFFVKSLDKLKADGVMAFITSKGTMDKESSKVRRHIAERAELLGAIRLPNNAFAATSGDVKVTTDILFLKKRERPIVADKEEWIYTNKNADGFSMNEYFVNHPEMVLGKTVLTKGQFGREEIACVDDGRNLREALIGAVNMLGEEYERKRKAAENTLVSEREAGVDDIFPEPEIMMLPERENTTRLSNENISEENAEQEKEKNNESNAHEDGTGNIGNTESGENNSREKDNDKPKCLEADPNVKNYCYTVIDDKVYYRENDLMISDDKIQGKKEERIKALVELRQDTNAMLNSQLREDISEEEIRELQKSLSDKYDKFQKEFGSINSKANTAAFKQDTDFPLVSGLEVVKDSGETEKADIFTKRTLSPYKTPEHCETSQEAYAVCLNEKREVDLEFIQKLTGKSEKETISDLKGLIYVNPKTMEWETADEYLSGKVVEKLKEAEEAAQKDGLFRENVEALKNVQPEYIQSHDIAVQIGAPWINQKYYTQFIEEKFAPNAYEKYDVHYNSILNSWHIEKPYS